MSGNDRRNVFRTISRETVRSSREDVNPCVRKERSEMLADSDWADRVAVAPEEERRRRNRPDFV